MKVVSPHRHRWRLSPKNSAALQSELAGYVRLVPFVGAPYHVVGADTAQEGERVYAAAVVMEHDTGRVVEIATSQGRAVGEYRSGYKAFHDGPVILKALEGLHTRPDLMFFHAQGVCHPRFLGMASHLGLLLDTPSIGVTKERLVGHYDPPGENRGQYSAVHYATSGVGAVVRTRAGTKPVFVSPGHLIDLVGAIEWSLQCATRYRLPEPLRRAHIEAGRYRRFCLERGD